jgi:carbamoyl-phosphate synthase large subunit
MKNILVSGASGIVGYGILRSLARSGKKLKLIGTSIYGDSVAPAFCDIFELAPPTNNDTYIDWLLDMIARHHIDLVIPGIEVDMYRWADHAVEIASGGAIPLLNNLSLVHLCKDKWSFYEHLRKAGMQCVIESALDSKFEILKERFGLPFLLKPRSGFGSRGIIHIHDEATFSLHQKDVGRMLMAQPVVGNDEDEYTTSAFCDGSGGSHALMTLGRKLSKDGFTEKAQVVDSDKFIGTILDLCKLLRPLGPTNFQFRKSGHEIKLLEVNPRISSSTSIRTAFGYNESAMAVDYFLEHVAPVQPEIRQGRAVRYIDEHIFLDYPS